MATAATETEILADIIARSVHDAVVPLKKQIAALEQRDREKQTVMNQTFHQTEVRISALEERAPGATAHDVADDPRVKAALAVLAEQRYCYVWSAEKSYRVGNRVTHGGQEWHCNVPSLGIRPGTSGDWTMTTKAGRDGRDIR